MIETDNAALRMWEALQEIHSECGCVCKQFPNCNHGPCYNSYFAWNCAGIALGYGPAGCSPEPGLVTPPVKPDGLSQDKRDAIRPTATRPYNARLADKADQLEDLKDWARAEYDLRRSYSGPDPDPGGTAMLRIILEKLGRLPPWEKGPKTSAALAGAADAILDEWAT